jgi:segregation and condensation protein B
LEAILYLKGRPVSVGELAELSQVERKEVEEALIALTTSYAQRESALEIVHQNGRFGLQLRAGLGDLVKDLLPVNLSTATLRTLATIALKKRILQSDLVDLRGSGAVRPHQGTAGARVSSSGVDKMMAGRIGSL